MFGPGSVSFVSNVIVIAGVLMAPIAIFSFFSRLKNEMKRDAGERFETAAQLQNSINSMMVAFVTALMRQGIQQGEIYSIYKDSKYEDWNLYEENGRANQHDHKVVLFPGNNQPLLGNRKRKTYQKSMGGGFLVGLLSGVSIFLLLALITVLTVKI